MKKYFLPFIVWALLAGSCGSKKENTAASEQASVPNSITLSADQLKEAGIATGTPVQQTISDTLLLNGSIDVPPQNIVSVSFPLGGYLKHTQLLPGMHVSKGERIALMEDQTLVQLQQDYLVARSRLKLAGLEYERQRTLNETKTASDKVFQQAVAELEAARAMESGLAEKLRLVHINPAGLSSAKISRFISIPSPINGFVSKVNVNIGKYVQPQDVLFELINPEDMHAALTVFEKDISKIQAGQKVTVRFVDEPATNYPAEVILVTRNVDENRSGMIHCHFEKMPAALKPGMFISATVQLGSAAVLAVPEEAIVRFDNKEWVFLVKGPGQFEAFPVLSGKKFRGWVELLPASGLLASQAIVITNAFTVLSAMKNSTEE